MVAKTSLSLGTEPIAPSASTDSANKAYVDSAVAAAVAALGLTSPTDFTNYGDIFAPLPRAVATSQDTLSAGYLSFSGGKTQRASAANVTKLRFHCRQVAPAGATVVMNLMKGSNLNSLSKVGADITVTATGFSGVGIKELTLPTPFGWNAGDYLYLAILRTGTGTPDPAMATSGGPANGDLFNPDSTHFIAGYKSGQSSIPNPLDTTSTFTASGRIFWWSIL